MYALLAPLVDSASALGNFLARKEYAPVDMVTGRIIIQTICPPDSRRFFADDPGTVILRMAVRKAMTPALESAQLDVPRDMQQLADRVWQIPTLLEEIETLPTGRRDTILRRKRRFEWMVPFMAELPSMWNQCNPRQPIWFDSNQASPPVNQHL